MALLVWRNVIQNFTLVQPPCIACRRKGNKSLVRMTVSGDSSETVSTDMIFEPILEHGVFRFDSSVDHRKAVFPSVSFKNSKDREVPIVSHSVPAYIPTSVCLQDQQVVTFEVSVSYSFSFLKTDLTMSILT